MKSIIKKKPLFNLQIKETDRIYENSLMTEQMVSALLNDHFKSGLTEKKIIPGHRITKMIPLLNNPSNFKTFNYQLPHIQTIS